MKKLIAILLCIVMVLSFTACGGNDVMEFKSIGSSIEILDTGEELMGSDEGFDGYLKVNQKKGKLEYNNGVNTFTADMEEWENDIDEYTCYTYFIRWDKTPVVVDGFDVYNTAIAIYPDDGIMGTVAYLMYMVEREGYYDLMVTQSWRLDP